MTDDRSLPLRDRQRTRVRGDIQRAALELFAEHGYDSVTTDDIAAAAGVSPSTYFRHVGSKEELLLTPVRRGGAAIVAHLEARPADEPAGLALTQAILARTNAFTETSESVTHWRTAILGAPHLLDRVSLVERDERRRLVKLVAERVGSTAGNEERAGLLVHVLLAAAEYAFQQWLARPHQGLEDLYELARQSLETTRGGHW